MERGEAEESKGPRSKRRKSKRSKSSSSSSSPRSPTRETSNSNTNTKRKTKTKRRSPSSGTSPNSDEVTSSEMLEIQKARAHTASLKTTVSFDALRRARTTIEDFVKTYFPLHDLPLTDFFQHLPILVWVEATIYRMDQDNERLAAQGVVDPTLILEGETEIVDVLTHQQLWDPLLQFQLNQGKEYWRMERMLCNQITKGEELDIKLVYSTSEKKSFDYRFLHLLLFKLNNKEYNLPLLDCLFHNEHLVDIHDDLVDYEKDVEKNSFNIYRMLVYQFGLSTAREELIKRIEHFERTHDEKLLLLPLTIQKKLCARESEAYEEGGLSADKWQIPSLVLEPSFSTKNKSEKI